MTIDRIRINDFFFAEDSVKVRRGWWLSMCNAGIDWPVFVLLLGIPTKGVGKFLNFFSDCFPYVLCESMSMRDIYIHVHPPSHFGCLLVCHDLGSLQVGAPIPGNYDCQTDPGWWFGTFFIFPYIWNVIIPIDSYFSEGFVQPPTRIIGWKSAASAKPMVCDPHNLLYGCLIPAERKDGASKVQFLQRHPSVQCWWVQCIKQPNSIQLVSN